MNFIPHLQTVSRNVQARLLIVLGVLALALTLAYPAVASEGEQVSADTEMTFTAVQDSTIWSGSNGNDTDPRLSNGAGERIIVGINGSNGGNRLMRSLVQFDLSAIPANATIMDASVQLTASSVRKVSTPLNVSLHTVNTEWGEGTSVLTENGSGGAGGGTATTGDATWTFSMLDTASWANPGGDFVAQASATVPVQEETTYTWTGEQIVADVQAWVDGTSGNYGWMIVSDETFATCCYNVQFDSREATETVAQPQLVVTYMVDGEAGSTSVSNGDFESSDGWTTVVTGNDPGFFNSPSLVQGGSGAFVFKADGQSGNIEYIQQIVAIENGMAGDSYMLTLYVAANALTGGGDVGARLILQQAGETVSTQICVFDRTGGVSGSFDWEIFNCSLDSAGGAHDAVEISIGYRDVVAGFIGIDTVSLSTP
ncbi:MAG: DNRLRE domain-containing protein [Chloroflexi bacterium]|nr:DNRLRE domain-containing protein [Chloroflexota bacterium]